LSDAAFESTMKATEKAAWQVFGDVDTNFLGSKNRHKNNNYTSIVNKTAHAFKDLGCNMSLKLHFLKSHLD
jgi:hypothetical protein